MSQLLSTGRPISSLLIKLQILYFPTFMQTAIIDFFIGSELLVARPRDRELDINQTTNQNVHFISQHGENVHPYFAGKI